MAATARSSNPCRLRETPSLKPSQEWRWLLLPLALLLVSIFTFDTRTEAYLAQLKPGFALKLRAAWGIIRLVLGLTPYPTSAKRTPAQQNAQHAANRKNPKYDPNKPSSHIDGEAMDCNYLDANGKNVLHSKSTRAQWAPVVAIYHIALLGWGGDFRTYYDAVHVQNDPIG